MADNLAKDIQESQLKDIGNRVCEDYRADISSRSEWEAKRAEWRKLLIGHRDIKSFPWKGCANVHIPLLGVAALQFQARAYEALIPKREIAKCFSTDGASVDAAVRASKYLNYQLTVEMDEWEEDMDTLFLQLPVDGSCVKKTYYDESLQRVSSRLLSVDEFVAPYGVKRLESSPRCTHFYYISPNDIKIRTANGEFLEIASKLEGGQGRQRHPLPEIKEARDTTSQETESFTPSQEEPRLFLEQHRFIDLDGDGLAEPYIVVVDEETEQVLSIQSRIFKDSLTGKDLRLEYFTAYTFFPNPDSWMGFGFGHLMQGLNETANTTINQLLDSGTLSNVSGKTGFISNRIGLKKGDIDITLGQFREVSVSGDDLKKNIYTYDFREPSGILLNLLGLIQNYAKEISSVSDSLLGKMPPSDTTATSMLAVMEQGMKMFSTIYKRIHRSFKKELQKIFFLNSQYLKENIYFAVQDSTSSEVQTLQSGKADFSNYIDVIPTSDPNITSRAEKLIKAQTAYQIIRQDPLTMQDPEINYEAVKHLLEANEAPLNIVAMVKKPEPPPPPPDLSQVEENALFLSEKSSIPLETQDHIGHIQILDEFMMSPWANELTPNGKNMATLHREQHMSMAYLQSEKEKEAMMGENGANMGGLPSGQGDIGGGMAGMDSQPMYEGMDSGTPKPEAGAPGSVQDMYNMGQ